MRTLDVITRNDLFDRPGTSVWGSETKLDLKKSKKQPKTKAKPASFIDDEAAVLEFIMRSAAETDPEEVKDADRPDEETP
jgi:hypothetical protein